MLIWWWDVSILDRYHRLLCIYDEFNKNDVRGSRHLIDFRSTSESRDPRRSPFPSNQNQEASAVHPSVSLSKTRNLEKRELGSSGYRYLSWRCCSMNLQEAASLIVHLSSNWFLRCIKQQQQLAILNCQHVPLCYSNYWFQLWVHKVIVLEWRRIVHLNHLVMR